MKTIHSLTDILNVSICVENVDDLKKDNDMMFLYVSNILIYD